MNYLKPDYILGSYSEISDEWLKTNNVKLILSDIDSTLAPHDASGDVHLKNWIQMLEKNNIKLILVSNNCDKRVRKFCNELNVQGLSECNKPKTRKIEKEIKHTGVSKENVIFLGDQLFTDIWCGKRLGVTTMLVNPVGNKQPWNIKLKRCIEKFILKKWEGRRIF